MEIRFPAPVKLGPSTTRWRLSDLARWEAAQASAPIEAPAQDAYLTDRDVAARYGIGRVTVWRWAREGAR